MHVQDTLESLSLTWVRSLYRAEKKEFTQGLDKDERSYHHVTQYMSTKIL